MLAAAVVAALAPAAAAQRQFDELVPWTRLIPRLPVLTDPTTSMVSGDLDGDGDHDIVIGNMRILGAQNRVYLNNGRAIFADATTTSLPRRNDFCAAMALGDVDGDGDLDLVCGNNDVYYSTVGSQPRLYLNDGRAVFTDATSRLPQATLGCAAVALLDADRDGDLDLFLGNFGRRVPSLGRNRLYRNNGAGFFADVTLTALPPDSDPTTSLATGDIDRDGDIDVIVGNWDSNGTPSRLYLNNGSGIFSDATATHFPSWVNKTAAVALGDVDGDGDLDLVTGNDSSWPYNGGYTRLHLNDGTGRLTDVTQFRMPLVTCAARCVKLGDLDEDGDLDILVGAASSAAQDLLLVNLGSGTFSDATTPRLPVSNSNTVALALADFDGDGDLDLVAGNHREQHQLLLNLRRHVASPLPIVVGFIYQLDAYARYGPPGIAWPFFGTAPAHIPVPGVGLLGVDPALVVQLPPILVGQPAGSGSWNTSIPAVPGLRGTTLYCQVLFQHLGHQRLTNVFAGVVY